MLAADPNVTYTNLPYITDAGPACGENSVNGSSGTLDGVSIVEGHELAETITDPLLNAWYDANGNETGDKCAWTGLSDITTSAGTFAVQPLWNNVLGCVTSSCGIMAENQQLYVNQQLYSCDGRFHLVLQADGNLVIYESGTPLWASRTVGRSSHNTIMQADGNFVIYNNAGGAVWDSGTAGHPGAWLSMQNDGNLVIYSSDGTAALWSTHAGGH